MGALMMSDFAVASNGHCFFCLNQIRALTPEFNLATQINSLQYFSRYLKMDLKKVFIDKEHVSPELLAKVEKARLKVDLCEGCSSLSERFSETYRQLEKLEIELKSTLRLIHGKLISTNGTGKLRGLAHGLNSNNGNGLLEVVEVLREEAIQKGSRKLSGTPQVKLQNLSEKEIRTKKSWIQNNFRRINQENSQFASSTNFMSDGGLELGGVKMESLNEECLSDNDNGNHLSDAADSNMEWETMENDAQTRSQEINSDVNVNENTIMVNKTVVSRARTAISMAETNKWTLDPETGKRKCNACQLEYNSSQAFNYHYRTVHLKVRYKCVSCNKLYSQSSDLRRHQRTSTSCSKMK